MTLLSTTDVKNTTYYTKSGKKYIAPSKPTVKATGSYWPETGTTGWHIAYNASDHYASYSYNQGASWSEPQAING